MTSMIQAYTQQLKNNYQPQRKPHGRQDDFRTHVKAYKPKGVLLDSKPFSLVESVKSDARSVKYFVDGISGHGNDYSIGKVNDIGIRLGALGIAGILATSKGSPFSKGMEFIGLACWLGAMSLWQKIAINAPLKKMKGVDLDQEYLNSAGHRKKFYNDAQFLCWDLMSDEQVYKMGDKLGVPKNIKNRRKAIENKARQVAVQGNTLGLLTAGFATPLVASLAADQLGKRVFSPLMTKIKEQKVSNKRAEIVENLKNYNIESDTLKFIEDNVKESMTAAEKSKLKSLLAGKTKDKALQETIAGIVDNVIATNETTSSQVVIDDNFNSKLIKLLTRQKDKHADVIAQDLKAMGAKYQNVLGFENISDYQFEVEEWLKSKINVLFSQADSDQAQEELIKLLQTENKVSALTNVETVKKEMTQMSKMIDIYNEKFFKDFKMGIWKDFSNSEGSVQAKVWDDMSKGILKAFSIDRDTMEEFVKGFSTGETPGTVKGSAQSLNKFNIIGNIYDLTLSDSRKFDKTMKKLAGVIAETTAKTDKHFLFSLAYLDRLQAILTQIDRKSGISPFAEKMKMLISEQRLAVLRSYVSTNETAFFPMKTMCILKNSRATLQNIAKSKGMDFNKMYLDFKKMLLNSQNIDDFIAKLERFEHLMIDNEDYNTLINTMFSDVPKAVKRYLTPELTKKMNASTHLSKALLFNLADDVHNHTRPMSPPHEIINSLKELNLYKYADDLFDIIYNNDENLANTIGRTVQYSDDKLKQLCSMIKLSADDIQKIKANDFSPIHNGLRGSSEVAGYLAQGGRSRLSSILSLLDIKSLDGFNDFTVIKTKTGSAAELVAPKMYDVFARKAKEVFNYNNWFRRVGIAFVALCGITAFGLSQIGKTNEFNPDIYEERKQA